MGPNIKIYINDVLKISKYDDTYISGKIGINAYYCNASFDNIAVSPNISGALAKRAATAQGTFGTPHEWNVITYNHPDYWQRRFTNKLRSEFRNYSFGWNYCATDGDGANFKYSVFSDHTNDDYEMVYAMTHGNDGLFVDYNNSPIYLRSGYGSRSAVFAGKTRFVLLGTCFTMYSGGDAPYDASAYLPVFKGAHAILGSRSSFTMPNNQSYCESMVKYFIEKWYSNKTVGIYPAWRDAIFQGFYYDNGLQIGNAPAVVFTVGDLYGQDSKVHHYWGWEEKTWNIYNGSTYISDADKSNYGYDGEVLIYNPSYGYPKKIGHKWSSIGSPDWSGITVLP